MKSLSVNTDKGWFEIRRKASFAVKAIRFPVISIVYGLVSNGKRGYFLYKRNRQARTRKMGEY